MVCFEIDAACSWHSWKASMSQFHVVSQSNLAFPPPLPLFQRPFHKSFSNHAVELTMFLYCQHAYKIQE